MNTGTRATALEQFTSREARLFCLSLGLMGAVMSFFGLFAVAGLFELEFQQAFLRFCDLAFGAFTFAPLVVPLIATAWGCARLKRSRTR